MKYPCIMRDDETGLYFVAESTGPYSWRYHKWKWRALIELWHWRWRKWWRKLDRGDKIDVFVLTVIVLWVLVFGVT